MPTSFRRVVWLAATALATLLSLSCGQVYRPVVIPIATNPPNPQNFHAVFGISSNVSSNPGSVLQIDVSGDTNIGVANMGINPTHAAALPGNQRIFVASAGSVIPGNPDTITSFSPAAQSSVATGIGNLTLFSLPNVGPNQSSAITDIRELPNTNTVNVTLSQAISLAAVGGQVVISGVNIGAYNGNFVITLASGNTIQYTNTVSGLAETSGGTATLPIPTFCSYLPDFVTTTQNSAVYVANYGVEGGSTCAFPSTDSIALLDPNAGTVRNIAYLNPGGSSPAPHPVAMAETPNAQNLYVVNQGDGVTPSTVVNLSPTDLTQLASITVGINPTWVVARVDNQRVYVLTQGDGLLVPIDTVTNTILQSQTNLSVGAGANFLLYDSNLNRLYVTNPTTGNVFVYSATGGADLSGNPNDTPRLLATISMGGGTNPACPGGCSPVSVTALPNGSRFYVASYRSESSCSDTNVGASACIVPMLTVFDAPSMTVKNATSTLLKGSPSLSLLSTPPFSATQYAVPPIASCAPAPVYTPGTTRFRMFTTSSSDSSHVYVSMCDAGAVAVVATTTNTINQGTNAPDTLVNNIAAPFGACSGTNCSFAAPISSFAITANVATFQAANNFIPGQQVQISGLGIGTYLNGQTLTVLQAGLSPTQFSANFTHPDVASTPDVGAAIGLQVAQITSLSINSNVVTFQGVNTFTPGTRVAISGLSSAPGSPLNGQTLTVIATGLSTKQFECVLNAAEGNVGSTSDTGVAVPQVPPQTPIFLVTGQ